MKRVVALIIGLVILCAAVPAFACGNQSGHGAPGFHGHHHHYGWGGCQKPTTPPPPPPPASGGGKGDTKGTGGK